MEKVVVLVAGVERVESAQTESAFWREMGSREDGCKEGFKK